jgi:AcrR family transcriptional regulator
MMTTLTRKQREIQQRERLILDVAEKMLLRDGYLGLSMDRVAEAIEYSKGTIYQHFTCKEDMIVALLVRTLSVREELFVRASKFRGRARERLLAIGVADQLLGRLYPDHEQIERILKVESIWDKATVQRRTQFLQRDNNCLSTMMGVIRDAVAQGDLAFREGYSERSLAFGLWSMATGARMIIVHGLGDEVVGDVGPERTQMLNYQMFLDGYGWRPLSTEWDYPAVVERVRAEVFADDLKKAGIS